MEPSLFICPICYHDFGLIARTPKMIPSCGHTVCSDCLLKIKNIPNINAHKCPFDQAPLPPNIDSYPKNFSLAHNIEERAKLEKCEEHNKPIAYLCLTEKKRICILCYRDHKSKKHDIEPIEAIEIQLEETIKEINALLEDVGTFHKNLVLKLKNNHQIQIKHIKNEHNKLRALIDEKEEKMIFQSKCCFDANVFKLETIFGEKSQMFTTFAKQRAELENILGNKAILREDFSGKIMRKIQAYRLKMNQNNNLLSQGTETDQKYNSLKKSIMGVVEELKRSLNNSKMPDLSDNLNKIATAFSDEDTKDGNIFVQDEDDSSLSVKSSLIIEYTEGVLRIERNTNGPSDIKVDLEKLNNVNKIQLCLKEIISNEDFQLLRGIWKKIINPATLKIILGKKALTDKLYELLLQVPMNFTQLDISYCFQDLESSRLPKFIQKFLGKTKFLKGLSLNFCATRNLSNQSLKRIFKNAELQHLEALNLDFGCTNIKDKDLLPLFVKMQNLKQFALDISRTQITNQCLEKCVQITFASSSFLEEVSLSTNGTQITDLDVENFLRNLKNLKKLHLNLSETLITSKTVYLLSQAVSKFPMIEDLNFRLADTKITDLNFQQLFKDLPNVRDYSLSLSNTQITDKTIESLIANTFSEKKNIRSICLSLSKTQITDNQILMLLENIPDVEKLTMNFSHTKVTDNSIIKFLTRKLPSLTRLNYLHIYLEDTKVSQMIREQVNAAKKKINQSSCKMKSDKANKNYHRMRNLYFTSL